MNNIDGYHRGAEGRIPVAAVVVTAVLLTGILLILLFRQGKPDGKEALSKTIAVSAAFTPLTLKTRAPRPEIYLSLNGTTNEERIYDDAGCLFRIRVFNGRAHALRAEKSSDSSVILGAEGKPWIESVRLFALPLKDGQTGPAREISGEILSFEPQTEGPLRLESENTASAWLTTIPETAGLVPGLYELVAVLMLEGGGAADSDGLPAGIYSNTLSVEILAPSASLQNEELDLRFYAQARIAILRGNMSEAEEILDRSLADLPDAPMSRLLRADLFEAEGRYEDAYRILKEALTRYANRTTDSTGFREPPSYLVERMNILRKKMNK